MLRSGMRRLLVVGGAAALLGVGAASSATPPGEPLPGTLLGSRMARAEVVVVDGGVVHDYRIDQGRLRANSPGELVIRERDGTLQTVPVSPTTRVTLNGSAASLGALRRGMHVLTVRDGDAPALLVRARALFP